MVESMLDSALQVAEELSTLDQDLGLDLNDEDDADTLLDAMGRTSSSSK
jgi:hypothetical protein